MPNIKVPVLLLFVSFLTFAGTSLVLHPGSTLELSDPTYPSEQSWRTEFQLHNWTLPVSGNYSATLFSLSGVGLTATIWPDGRLLLQDQRDWLSPAQPCFLSLAGTNNVLVRVQRDLAQSKVTCELWQTTGGGYLKDEVAITSRRPWSYNGAGFGGAISASLGFLRVSTSILPPGGRPPATADSGDWTDLKFDGNLTDSSGHNHGPLAAAAAAATPSLASFAATPGQTAIAYAKTSNAPTWSNWASLRAGYPAQLDGSRSFSLADGSSSVNYSWTQTSGPTTLVWSNAHVAQPTIQGLIFGTYEVRLDVTAANGSTGAATLQFGAVAANDNGVVIYPDSRLDAILGPSTIFGGNAWEWFDARNLDMFNHWADNYEINGGTWKLESDQTTLNGVPRNGTVYAGNGDSKIYGSGTNFLNVFCGGKAGPAVGLPYIIPKLPTGVANDAPRPYPRVVQSCQSDTQLTMLTGWSWDRNTVSAPGVAWGTWNICADCGQWQGLLNTSNINFYDNALANYALYYRSGYSKARDSARWLADRWYRSPWILSGLATTPRDFGLTSAYIRAAVDGGMPDYDPWPSLRSLNNACFDSTNGYIRNIPIADVRETSYCLAYDALAAMLDPDPASKATAQSRLISAYNLQWGAQQQPDGSYINNEIEGDFSRNFTVSRGSSTVTLKSGPPLPANYCGNVLTSNGQITVNADRITVFGAAGANFTGAAGKIMVLRGTLAGKPWSMSTPVASVVSPTILVLANPWRGDVGSVLPGQWIIYSDSSINGSGYYNMFFGETTASGTYTSPQVVDKDNWYWCTVNSPQTITLDKPYTGETTGGKVYRRPSWQNLAGRGSQPFMEGIASWALNYASKALATYDPATSSKYSTAADRVVDWIWTSGRNPVTKGLFYGTGFSNCQNLSILPADECGQGISGSSNERAYNVEANSGFAQKYLHTRDSADLTRGNQWYTDQFARTGYKSPFAGDGYFAELIDQCCATYNNKAYGQTFGVGQGHQWPAVFAGGVTSRVEQATPVSYNTQISKTVRITVTEASSAVTQFNCTASPCSITIDGRQGTFWMRIDYLSGSKIIATAGPLLGQRAQVGAR